MVLPILRIKTLSSWLILAVLLAFCWKRYQAFSLVTQKYSPKRTTTSMILSMQQAESWFPRTTRLGSSTVDVGGNDSNWLDSVGFVLLAGGKGSRMKASVPKQFLELNGEPILHYSLDLFLNQLATTSSSPPYVVLVVDPMYQPDYEYLVQQYAGRFAVANPGVERQGSVENGLQKLVELSTLMSSDGRACTYAAIHDSARPLVTLEEIRHVVQDAKEYGAAVLAVPCKATIKESADGGTTVLRTVPRSRLFEVHTPQVIRIETLLRGFQKVADEQLEVTDDVSIVEALGEPVKLTFGQYTNLKITTPEDMAVAQAILAERQQAQPKFGKK